MPVVRLRRLPSGQMIWSAREPASPVEVVQAPAVPEDVITEDTFVPDDHSVAEVLAYMRANPSEKARVQALEASGKQRSTILNA
jgi:hypothetical protein